jgi:hypothetical protein
MGTGCGPIRSLQAGYWVEGGGEGGAGCGVKKKDLFRAGDSRCNPACCWFSSVQDLHPHSIQTCWGAARSILHIKLCHRGLHP